MRALMLVLAFGLLAAGCISEPAPTPQPPPEESPTSTVDYAPSAPSRIEDCFEPGVAQYAPGGEEATMVCLVKQAVESGDCIAYFSPANVARIDAIVAQRLEGQQAESFEGVRKEALEICQGFILIKNALSSCSQQDIDSLAAFAGETSGFSLSGSPGGIDVMLSSPSDCRRLREGDETVCDAFSSSRKQEQCRIAAQNTPQSCRGDVDCLLGLAMARLTPEPCRLVAGGEERARCFFFIDFFVDEDVCAWEDESSGKSVCIPTEDDTEGTVDGTPTATGFTHITPEVGQVVYPSDGPIEIPFTNSAGDTLTPVSAILEVPGGSCTVEQERTQQIAPGDSFVLSFPDCPTPTLGAVSVLQADVSVTFLLEKTGTIVHAVEGTIPLVVAE